MNTVTLTSATRSYTDKTGSNRKEVTIMKQNEQSIGMYGRMWMQNMEKNYPEKVELMMFYHRYLTVARSVDRRASEYWEQLSDQYDKRVPRPTDSYEAVLDWSRNKKLEIDHLIMTEVVLVPVTTP